MTRMEQMARNENLASAVHWSASQQAPAKVEIPQNDSHKMVQRVMSSLREGLGADDMAALGTCTADEARQVIAWMRANGSLAAFYRGASR